METRFFSFVVFLLGPLLSFETSKEGGWQIKQIDIIGGTLGSVHVGAFEEMLKVMEVKKKAWTAIRKGHVRRLLEAQLRKMRFCYGVL